MHSLGWAVCGFVGAVLLVRCCWCGLLVHLCRIECPCPFLSLLICQFLALIITEVESVFQFLRDACGHLGSARANFC